jgi:hypothetical protein
MRRHCHALSPTCRAISVTVMVNRNAASALEAMPDDGDGNGLSRGEGMRSSEVFSVVAVLGALAVMQVSVDAAAAAKKPPQENHVEKDQKKDQRDPTDKKDKKERKQDKKDRKQDKKDHNKDKKDKKDKKDDKDKKEDKDKKDPREINNCPGGLSKDCDPGACRCPAPSEQQEQLAKQQKEPFEKNQKQWKDLLEKLRNQNDHASASKASKKKSELCPEWQVVTGP